MLKPRLTKLRVIPLLCDVLMRPARAGCLPGIVVCTQTIRITQKKRKYQHNWILKTGMKREVMGHIFT
ncbi:MAG: hypothetical protein D5R99_06675 [Methanocalculus sp. MSAO_Arc1]|nr:MAG: hypothetical protein D5R99_06675 [Methanocalculus sp. MSAO_Arc1]